MRPRRTVVRGLLLAAYVAGGGSLLVFALHLWAGSLGLLELRVGEGSRLALDAGLSLGFFLQHSVMIRRPFRERFLGWLPPELQPSLYAVVSGLFLLAVVLLWQRSEVILMEVHGAGRWLLRGVFLLGLAGFFWAARALRGLDALGARDVHAYLANERPPLPSLAARGPYRWVRHPLYLFSLMLIWSCPVLSADRLLFNLLWTAWIVLGTVLEERDLVEVFGDSYREYRRRVPMLIPWRRPPDGAGEPPGPTPT